MQSIQPLIRINGTTYHTMIRRFVSSCLRDRAGAGPRPMCSCGNLPCGTQLINPRLVRLSVQTVMEITAIKGRGVVQRKESPDEITVAGCSTESENVIVQNANSTIDALIVGDGPTVRTFARKSLLLQQTAPQSKRNDYLLSSSVSLF